MEIKLDISSCTRIVCGKGCRDGDEAQDMIITNAVLQTCPDGVLELVTLDSTMICEQCGTSQTEYQ